MVPYCICSQFGFLKKFQIISMLSLGILFLLPEQGVTAWKVLEIADSVGLNQHPSIEVDGTGAVHVLYCTESGFLSYARGDGTSWNKKTMDSLGIFCHQNYALTVDSKGYPHMCYYQGTTTPKHLKYAFQTQFGWYSVVVDDAHFETGESCDIALDSAENPHFSYTHFGGTGVTIQHAYWNPGGIGSWITEEALSDSKLTGRTNLAMDNFDLPQISYYSSTDDGVRYLRKLMGVWGDALVDYAGAAFRGHETPIVIDKNGQTSIAFFDNGDRPFGRTRRVYATQVSLGVWQKTEVVPWNLTGTEGNIGLALDNSGQPGMCYEDDGHLIYQHRADGTTWTRESIDTDIESSGEMAFGLQGRPYFIYIKKDEKLYVAVPSFPWNLYLPAILKESP